MANVTWIPSVACLFWAAYLNKNVMVPYLKASGVEPSESFFWGALVNFSSNYDKCYRLLEERGEATQLRRLQIQVWVLGGVLAASVAVKFVIKFSSYIE